MNTTSVQDQNDEVVMTYEEIMTYDVSDEQLEMAAAGKVVAGATIWLSPFASCDFKGC